MFDILGLQDTKPLADGCDVTMQHCTTMNGSSNFSYFDLFPRAQGDLFTLLVLSGEQSKTQRCLICQDIEQSIKLLHLRSWNQKIFLFLKWLNQL